MNKYILTAKYTNRTVRTNKLANLSKIVYGITKKCNIQETIHHVVDKMVMNRLPQLIY